MMKLVNITDLKSVASIGFPVRVWVEAPSTGPVVQWLEPAAHNGIVGGSNPSGPTNPLLAQLDRATAF